LIFCNNDIEGLDTAIRHLQDEVNGYFSCTLHIGVGKSYNNILFAKDSYSEAGKALEYKILKKQSSVLYYEDIASFFAVQSAVTEKTAGRITENAKKYIKEHLSEEITLNKLSEVLFVHPVYICRLFKEELGENFIDYLKKVRIEKSKELLSDLSLKVYEVSEMVGYDSPKYFSKLFKEITGATPKEFQNNYTKV
jgi:YesN/AraC family two-component response regulator